MAAAPGEDTRTGANSLVNVEEAKVCVEDIDKRERGREGENRDKRGRG